MKYTVAQSRTDTIVRYDIIPKKRGRTASEILSRYCQPRLSKGSKCCHYLRFKACHSVPVCCSAHPPQVVHRILSFLSLMNARKICVKFVWVPSHMGLCHNATADRLAKEACRLPPRGDERPLFLPCYLSRVRTAAFLAARRRTDAERPDSVTITHYESVCRHKYSYRRWGLMVRRQCCFRASMPGLPSTVAGRWGGGGACIHGMSPVPLTKVQHHRALLPGQPHRSWVATPKDSRWMLYAATS